MSRCDTKLRYARMHIDELEQYPNATSNDDWENAHQEDVFFHLAGAADAIMHEINKDHSLRIPLDKVNYERVKKALKNNGKDSPAFKHWNSLKKDKSSWLRLLFELRNHGTHRQHINKVLQATNIGTKKPVDNEFIDPRNGMVQTVYPGLRCQETLVRLASDVKKLIDECRELDPNLQ